MGIFTVKLPDVGEGVAEAELVEWNVAIGDVVHEDQILAAVMTDKATVEIPSEVAGKVIWLCGDVGEIIAIGSGFIKIEIDGEGNSAEPAEEAEIEKPVITDAQNVSVNSSPEKVIVADEVSQIKNKPVNSEMREYSAQPLRLEGEKPLASPAVRLRAREAGIDLRKLTGTGGAGRITHDDLDLYFEGGNRSVAAGSVVKNTDVTDVKIIGMRRKIAEKMSLSKSRIPHITIVEEVDVSALEELRASLNKGRNEGQPKLTILPFIMMAMRKAIKDQPGFNARFDDDNGVVRQHGGIHIGVAAQTPSGLSVPVVKHVEARDIWSCANEVNRLANAAKSGTATRDELTGSTITITSLGALGAIATTPVINYPEVAIVGVNKMAIRPMWDGSQFIPRKMMNLSSSFDHRVIDGWDAALFVQALKLLLETPARIFMEC